MNSLENKDYVHRLFDEYDLNAQLIAIRDFLVDSSNSERVALEETKELACQARELGSKRLVDLHNDIMHMSVYSGAAHSAAAVGMLAPFVENLFTGIFRGIGQEEDDYLGRDRNSQRSQNARRHFWDPHLTFGRGDVKGDLVAGIMQLAESSKLAPDLPKDTKQVLQALFEYRNAMLHNGFEWAPERREAFGKRVATWDSCWFLSAQSGGKPWVWYLSEVFIYRVLEFVDEVIEVAGKHVRQKYYSAPD